MSGCYAKRRIALRTRSPITPPVAQLLDAVYINGVLLGRLEPNDFALFEFLKSEHPDFYASLDKAARNRDKVLY